MVCAKQNDYWDLTENYNPLCPNLTVFDCWSTDRPCSLPMQKITRAVSDPVPPECCEGSVEDYEEFKFVERVEKIILEHDASTPLFLAYNLHVTHDPLQVPLQYYQQFQVECACSLLLRDTCFSFIRSSFPTTHLASSEEGP